jgi:hypothetical protein
MAGVLKPKENQELLPDESTGSATPEGTPEEIPPTEDEASEFSKGIWVRQVFTDAQGQKKIATTFVPDNPEEAAEREIEDYDDENTDDWKQLLGDPPGINIDEGIAILRLDETAETATTSWVPNIEAGEILRKTLKQTTEQPGQPTANLREFRNCFRNQAVLGLRRMQRFRRCRHHLLP